MLPSIDHFVEGVSIRIWIKLYNSKRPILYLNYFHDLKLLIDWLGVYIPPELSIDTSSVPWYHANYEIQELAKHLGCSDSLVLKLLQELQNE